MGQHYRPPHPTSVISYMGGKSQLIKNIVPIITYATQAYSLQHYYELCGGGARMLLSLPPHLYQSRTYNELDVGLCKLFACLGNYENVCSLSEQLERTGVSEEVFQQAKAGRAYENRIRAKHPQAFGIDLVTSAKNAFILAMQSRASDMQTFDPTRKEPKRRKMYMKRVQALPHFYSTMQGVNISCGSCFDYLEQIKYQQDTFVYLDPPYVPDTMSTDQHYGERSWDIADHQRIVDLLKLTKAKVALSGYDHTIYGQLVDSGWHKIYLKEVVVSSATTGRKKEEYLWVNFDIPTTLYDQIHMFDYTRPI